MSDALKRPLDFLAEYAYGTIAQPDEISVDGNPETAITLEDKALLKTLYTEINSDDYTSDLVRMAWRRRDSRYVIFVIRNNSKINAELVYTLANGEKRNCYREDGSGAFMFIDAANRPQRIPSDKTDRVTSNEDADHDENMYYLLKPTDPTSPNPYFGNFVNGENANQYAYNIDAFTLKTVIKNSNAIVIDGVRPTNVVVIANPNYQTGIVIVSAHGDQNSPVANRKPGFGSAVKKQIGMTNYSVGPRPPTFPDLGDTPTRAGAAPAAGGAAPDKSDEYELESTEIDRLKYVTFAIDMWKCTTGFDRDANANADAYTEQLDTLNTIQTLAELPPDDPPPPPFQDTATDPHYDGNNQKQLVHNEIQKAIELYASSDDPTRARIFRVLLDILTSDAPIEDDEEYSLHIKTRTLRAIGHNHISDTFRQTPSIQGTPAWDYGGAGYFSP